MLTVTGKYGEFRFPVLKHIRLLWERFEPAPGLAKHLSHSTLDTLSIHRSLTVL